MANWTYAQQVRLGYEASLLKKELPHFDFYNPTVAGETTVQGYHTTAANRSYLLCIKVRAGFPNQMPYAYILWPCPLVGYGGKTIQSYGTHHKMHVFGPDWNNYARPCLVKEEFWRADNTIVGLVLKGFLWLEAFEVHCRTGKDIESMSLSY
ncbi:MAG TPA: hypothetical protein VJO32_01505 [Ktedonobacteraceae bacterium]|nr:hypothetical protein [Ktedonobacteraceae bacterium]